MLDISKALWRSFPQKIAPKAHRLPSLAQQRNHPPLPQYKRRRRRHVTDPTRPMCVTCGSLTGLSSLPAYLALLLSVTLRHAQCHQADTSRDLARADKPCISLSVYGLMQKVDPVSLVLSIMAKEKSPTFIMCTSHTQNAPTAHGRQYCFWRPLFSSDMSEYTSLAYSWVFLY